MEETPRPRTQRLPSRLDILSNGLKLDVRAHQRTYEGAYTRTAIGALSFSILIIKLFSKEFLPVGAVYTIYGCVLYFFGVFKSASVDVFYNPDKDMVLYKTGGDSVLLLTVVSLVSYLALLVLVWRM
ncbi:hypothetical protein CLIB1423_07S05336 [[Candida] railenensis]|uniref:Uncharacterized protein n=1 Tax=[Candida] railenensis TaxID=45579 RepID=A0A9P0VY66_9ASCO|nr:hypothetical protein CLIB1423_07S05336 [[Candida] railenensis]